MKVITIYNNLIPFEGYKAMAIFPFVFVRKDCEFDDTDLRHETIHLYQQGEVTLVACVIIALLIALCSISAWWLILGVLFYYLWYGTEYAIRYVAYSKPKEAYRNISFEQEAYNNEKDVDYLKNRKPFAWMKYIFKKTYHWVNPYWE